MREFELPDAAATVALGERLGAMLPLGTLVLLTGDLGAGKTTLSQGLAKGLGITEPVGSPTFTLLGEYPGTRGTLYHADLYRLHGESAVESTGIPEYVGLPDSLLLVEWPDRWPYWPEDALQITIHHAGAARRAEVRGPEALLQGLGAV